MPHSTFHCVYCNVEHPADWEAEEHVILRSWGNRNLVLRGTCKGWNAFFARSFENVVARSPTFAETRARMVPGAPATEFILPAADGRRIRRVASAEGVREEPLPVPITGNRTGVVLHDPHGKHEPFVAYVTLPDEIEIGASGERTGSLRRANRNAPRGLPRIQQHIEAALADRSADPELHDALAARGIDRVALTGHHVEEGPEGPRVQPILDGYGETSLEAGMKLMVKTAWCYTRLRVGEAYGGDPLGQRLLRALKEHQPITDEVEQYDRADEILRAVSLPAPVGEVALWTRSVPEMDKFIAANGAPEWLRAAHGRRTRARRALFRQMAGWRQVEPDAMGEDLDRYRWHEIEMHPLSADGEVHTWVRVTLFGGRTSVFVRVSRSELGGYIRERIELG